MPHIFGKLWHLALIWAIRKAFQCILQGVRFLLANQTLLSGTSEDESYAVVKIIDLIDLNTSKEAASSLTIEEKVGDRNATVTR